MMVKGYCTAVCSFNGVCMCDITIRQLCNIDLFSIFSVVLVTGGYCSTCTLLTHKSQL